jgi:protein-export membrane protein SecD
VRRTRGLWASVIFVTVLSVASTIGLVTGALRPTLGLDLQGGVAVILTAPPDTPPEVMERTLENIRARVDGFGVGEPQIFLSGTTIEVQIPGTSDSTIEERAVDLYCVAGADGESYGCAPDEETAREALEGLEVTSRPSEVCLVTADGDELQCFTSQQEAAAAAAGLTVQPQADDPDEPSPTAPPTVGPGPAAEAYCVATVAGEELACYDSRAEAQEALDGVTGEVAARQWCVTPVTPEPPADDDQTPATTAPPAFAALDRDGAQELPCRLETRREADDALAALEVSSVATQYCVVGADGQDIGCSVDREAAERRQRATGQERLLAVIGQTARLEQRPTLEIIPPGDPRYETIPVTCPEGDESEPCQGGALDGESVVYLDEQGNKVRLAPVVLTGGNIRQAAAQLSGGTPENPLVEWMVTFDLDGPGSDAFATATNQAVASPPPQNQIAIVVDRTIISNPVVQSAITGGSGQITGNFTEDEAKELATILNAGALPVELTQQSVRTVSPTLGEESLRQGVVAGIVGLILLFLYLLSYYRLLGIVALLGMSMWAVLALALVSLAGEQFGYALTLAGVAGLVISLGVTADSYIVYFERLKDEMRGGRSARSVVNPAFKRAFRTIIAADIVTGIAAVVLYLTAVSSVRGFALTLGVATLLDLFVVWFFKRPAVILIANKPKLVDMRGFGLTSATARDHAALDTTGGPTP